MLKFDFCRALGILKRQVKDKKYFLEWSSNPWKYYIFRAEIEKYFVQFLVQMKVVEFAFEINWPLVSLFLHAHWALLNPRAQILVSLLFFLLNSDHNDSKSLRRHSFWRRQMTFHEKNSQSYAENGWILCRIFLNVGGGT